MDISFSPWLNSLVIWVLITFLPIYTIVLVITSIGFFRYLYFITIGYASTILSLSLFSMVFYWKNISFTNIFQLILLALYGLRLLVFLIHRETTQNSYQKEIESIDQKSIKIPLFAKIFTWIIVSLLYVLMFSPVLFNLQTSNHPICFIQSFGLMIMLFGFSLEIIADQQKTIYKTKHPHHYCDIGFYRWVRFPNYLGEILFWIGNWTSAWLAYQSSINWLLSLTGLIGIIFVMLVSSYRLEQKQLERYEGDSEFLQYIRSTPILIPWLPIYSIKSIVKPFFNI